MLDPSSRSFLLVGAPRIASAYDGVDSPSRIWLRVSVET